MSDFFKKIANQNFSKSTIDKLEKEQLLMHLQLVAKIVEGLKPMLDEYEKNLKLLGYCIERYESTHYFRFTIRDSNSYTLEIGLGHYFELGRWSIAAKHRNILVYNEGPLVNESWQNADFEKWMQKQILEFTK